MSDKRGFLLLEVIVSIVIITSGLVFVMRAYSTSKNGIQRSSVLFDSALLLESRMFEYEEKGLIEKDFKDEKQFADNKDYSWSIKTTAGADDPVFGNKLDLNVVTLEVSRQRDKLDHKSYTSSYSLATYLDNKTGK